MRYIIWFTVFLCYSCEKKSDWSTNTDNHPKLVVQALLTNEYRIQDLRLSLSTNELNQAPTPVEDASVTVSTANNSFQFTHAAGGRYLSTVPFSVSRGIPHQLTIDWNGVDYLALSTDTTVAPMPPIEFAPIQSDSTLLRINETIPLYSAFEQSMYQFDIDWRQLTGDSAAIARIYDYTFSDYHINEILPPPKQVVRFPIGTPVIVRKYGLNDAYAHFLMSVLIATEWNGNVFYSSPSSPPSNISNGGLGFFAVSRVLTDTLIAQ